MIVVTGGSSGIGQATAMKLAEAGAKVIIVARDPEKLEATRKDIAAAGGKCFTYSCDLADMNAIDSAGEEDPRRAQGRRLPRQQRRPLDPPRRAELARPLPRLRADDAAQLLRPGAPDPRVHAEDGRAEARAHHQHQLDRRAVARAALLGLRRVEVGARRVLRVRGVARWSTRASTSPTSTCRWCARR